MHMSDLPNCMYLCLSHAYLVPLRSEEGIRLPGLGVKGATLSRQNQGPLQEQCVCLTDEAYLQPQVIKF